MSKVDISIIIPFLNEAGNIPFIIEELNAFCKTNTEKSMEFIFVDDGSTDGSVPLLLEGKKEFPSRVIKFSKNYGSHAALRAGILHSRGEYVTFIYADLQDPLDLINRLYEKCKVEGNDICWASRMNFTTSFMQRTFSKGYVSLIRKYVSKQYPENGFDVVMFNTKVKDVLNKNIESHSSIFLQVLTLGFKNSFIEYTKLARRAGKSKWTFSKKIKMLIDSFISFSFAPIRMVSQLGILFFLVGLVWSTYIIFRKIIFDDLASGWPMLMSVLLVGFGLTNISLGIIAEYLWRTLDASRKRPVFIVDEVIEIEQP